MTGVVLSAIAVMVAIEIGRCRLGREYRPVLEPQLLDYL
jgi:hypothetical protein